MTSSKHESMCLKTDAQHNGLLMTNSDYFFIILWKSQTSRPPGQKWCQEVMQQRKTTGCCLPPPPPPPSTIQGAGPHTSNYCWEQHGMPSQKLQIAV